MVSGVLALFFGIIYLHYFWYVLVQKVTFG